MMQRKFPTAIEDITLNLIFAVLGERRFNRTRADIASRLPALKVLSADVNKELKRIHQQRARSGAPLPQICRFQAGDQRYTFDDYPKTISLETVRTALEISGLRRPRTRRTKSF
jgi:hypothetical protein